MQALEITGGSHDAGDPQSMLRTNRFILQAENQSEPRLRVDPSARIEASSLIAPVSIGAEALVVDSVVGPNVSLDEGCVAWGSHVAETICRPQVQIGNVEISRAALGEGAPVAGSKRAVSSQMARRSTSVSRDRIPSLDRPIRLPTDTRRRPDPLSVRLDPLD